MRKANKAVSFRKTLSANPERLEEKNGRAFDKALPLLVNSFTSFKETLSAAYFTISTFFSTLLMIEDGNGA